MVKNANRKFHPLVYAAATVGAFVATAHADYTYKLFPGDGGQANANFGSASSISGNTAVVGSDFRDGKGAAYVYNVATGAQTFKLVATDGAAGDFFGVSASVSGNRAVIGAPIDNDNGSQSGSAYIFDTSTGTQLFKLLASDGTVNDILGESVSISGNTVVVGAQNHDVGVGDSGKAYVFNATTGLQTQVLFPTDPAGGDNFGASVSVDGNRALVGAYLDDDNGVDSGSAYILNTTTGTQQLKLLPTDGAAGDLFGLEVALKGNLALVSSISDDVNGVGSGSAYLFNATTGAQLFKLVPTDGVGPDGFGRSVALDGNFAVIGTSGRDDNGLNSGAFYLFDVTTGIQLAKFLPGDGTAGDRFGWSIGIDGYNVLVGAIRDDEQGASAGSAYLFSIPEPSTCGLMALGMLGVLRRSNRHAAR